MVSIQTLKESPRMADHAYLLLCLCANFIYSFGLIFQGWYGMFEPKQITAAISWLLLAEPAVCH